MDRKPRVTSPHHTPAFPLFWRFQTLFAVPRHLLVPTDPHSTTLPTDHPNALVVARIAQTVTTLWGLRPTTRSSMPDKGMGFFSSPERPGQFWNSLNLRFNVYWGSIQRIKRPGREADHLHLMQRLMNGVVPPLLPYVFMVWTVDNFLPAHNAYEDGTEFSETSAHKIQTPWNHPKEQLQLYLYFISSSRLGKCKKVEMCHPAAVVSGSHINCCPHY